MVKITENIAHAQIVNTGIANEQIHAMPQSRAVFLGSSPAVIAEL